MVGDGGVGLGRPFFLSRLAATKDMPPQSCSFSNRSPEAGQTSSRSSKERGLIDLERKGTDGSDLHYYSLIIKKRAN